MPRDNPLTDAIAKLDLHPNSIILIDGNAIAAEQLANSAPDGYVGKNTILAVFDREGKSLKDCIQQFSPEELFEAAHPVVPNFVLPGCDMTLDMLDTILKILQRDRIIVIRAFGHGKMDLMPEMINAVAERAVEITLDRLAKR